MGEELWLVVGHSQHPRLDMARAAFFIVFYLVRIYFMISYNHVTFHECFTFHKSCDLQLHFLFLVMLPPAAVVSAGSLGLTRGTWAPLPTTSSCPGPILPPPALVPAAVGPCCPAVVAEALAIPVPSWVTFKSFPQQWMCTRCAVASLIISSGICHCDKCPDLGQGVDMDEHSGSFPACAGISP